MDWKRIEEVNKKLPKTDIKGRGYVEVNARVKAFRELFPEGSIETEIVSDIAGICCIKATIKDKGAVIATGHAYEKESSTFINKTSYIENCVPLTTEILTKDGWKYYYQISEGDEVLSYNEETRKMEFCKVLRINTYKDRSVLNLSTSRFNVTCTPKHKWLARGQHKELQKVATEALSVSWKIVQAVKQDVMPSILGRKLGWLMCDCEIAYANNMPSTAYINQSKHVDDIEELFGKGRKTKVFNEKWLPNYEWTVPAEEVREILGKFDIASYADLPRAVSSADIEDVMGCYQSMMLADGGERGFSSTYKELVEAVQIMCARLGIATTFITSRMMEKSTKPIYTLGIKKTDGAYFSEMVVKNMPPQDVWCPTTENGTWVMREGTFVTLTSNCETSAVGRALGFIGIGIDTSIASYEEVGNAIANQERMKTITASEAKVLVSVAMNKGWGNEKEASAKILEKFGVERLGEITKEQYAKFAKELED